MRLFFAIILSFVSLQTAQAIWTKQNAGTLAWLRAIYFLNENRGWIAGSRGTFLVTTDNGKTWQQHAKFTEDTIRDVHFTDEQAGWILCERDVFGSGSLAPSYLMKTANGGETWEKVEFSDGRERIARMFFTARGYGYAVGESGTLFVMQDDRKSWKKSPLPSRYLLLDGVFSDELHGAIVGGGRTILFTEDAGLTWNSATVTGQTAAKLNSIFFIDQKNGWTVGANGKIYATSNGGRLWREQSSNVDKDLLDVCFNDTARGWAVGEQGTILHTTTAGNVWNVVESNGRHKLEKIVFAGKKGFAVGFGGTLLVYEAEKPEKAVDSKPQLQRRSS